MVGRYGVWVVTTVVASACLGVSGSTAAVASPGIGVTPSMSQQASVPAGTYAAGVSAAGAHTAVLHGEGAEPGPTSVPETPSADVPVAGASEASYTPTILMAGLVFLGAAILMVVRAGSTRQIDEPQ